MRGAIRFVERAIDLEIEVEIVAIEFAHRAGLRPRNRHGRLEITRHDNGWNPTR